MQNGIRHTKLPPNRTSGYASYLQVVPFMVA